MKILLLTSILLLIGCSSNNENKENFTLTKNWKLIKAESQSGIDITSKEQFSSFLFNEDGTFVSGEGENSSEGTYLYDDKSLVITYSENLTAVEKRHDVSTHTNSELVLIDQLSKSKLQFEAVEFVIDVSLHPSITISGDSYAYLVYQVTSGSPDYSYIYGGTKLVNGKAKMIFETVPDEALNIMEKNGETQKLGVAVIIVISGKKIQNGKLVETDDLNNRIVGAVSNIELIYKAGDINVVEWTSKFKPGFSLGKGERASDPNSSHDIFVPIENKTLIIIKNFILPNWT